MISASDDPLPTGLVIYNPEPLTHILHTSYLSTTQVDKSWRKHTGGMREHFLKGWPISLYKANSVISFFVKLLKSVICH